MNRWFYIGLWGLSFLLSSTLTAQEKENNKNLDKEFEKAWQAQEKAFEQFREGQNKDFLKFKRALDQAYAKALAKNWKSYSGQAGEKKKDAQPKISQIPEARPAENESRKSQVLEVLSTNQEVKEEIPNIQPPKIIREPLKTPKSNLKSLNWQFYGNAFPLPQVNFPAFPNSQSIDQNMIADFWAKSSQSNYAPLLQGLWQEREKKHWNDWAFYQAIKQNARLYYPQNVNAQKLFTWFILQQSGFRSRIGYSGNQVHLLLPCQSKIYEKTYFSLNGGYFYAIESENGSHLDLRIADFEYPEAKNIMSLEISKVFGKLGSSKSRTLNFRYQFRDRSIQLEYQPAWADFMESYPLTDLEIYFRVRPSPVLQASIRKNVAPQLVGMNPREQLNFLLAFVQLSFDYQTDQEQFGYERPLTVEESLHHPYSDCEDRSIFFSYLVQELLNYPVLMLDYPGHLATAVHLNPLPQGEYLEYQGKKYLVCDPTYKNAECGLSMPSLAGIKPKLRDF